MIYAQEFYPERYMNAFVRYSNFLRNNSDIEIISVNTIPYGDKYVILVTFKKD